jgi:isopentenyl-diphosphate Delta-isomerase
MTFRVPKMTVNRVNSKDHVIGRLPRNRLFAEKANFRVVHVIVRNGNGQVLLQKIAPGLRHEGSWGSSAAGYLKAGETYPQAAARKIKEELGLASQLRFYGRTSMLDNGCRKFIGVFSTRHDGTLKLMPSHVAGIEFVSVDEIVDAALSGARSLTPTFRHVMRYLEPRAFRRVPETAAT